MYLAFGVRGVAYHENQNRPNRLTIDIELPQRTQDAGHDAIAEAL